MIPAIIHQTAKTTQIPDEWKPYQKIVKGLHPTWEYRLWTDTDNLALIAASKPRWLSLYKALPRNIMRADMIRYVILELFGGLYLDLDYEFFRPFDLLSEKIVLPSESDPGEDIVLGNCILASEAGHPFWGLALKEMEDSFSSLGREPLEQDVIWLTGPGLLTRTYRKYSRSDASICVPPRSSFHPRTPRNQVEYAAVREIPGVYGVHHCAGTWRAKSLTQRLGRKILGFRVSAREKRRRRQVGESRS